MIDTSHAAGSLMPPCPSAVVFEQNGIAALSDLQDDTARRWLRCLEAEQTSFRALESLYSTGRYPWPRDPLHWWSRVWEYPYVMHALDRWLAKGTEPRTAHVVDHGSGVTFMPFAVAKRGCRVTCTDTAPVCGEEILAAARAVAQAPGSVDFRLASQDALPFSDGEVDCLYSVSVVEHVADIRRCIEEIARVLRPGGLLVLTCDLDLRGDQPLGIDAYAILVDALQRRFAPWYPTRTVHPRNQLASDMGPYALPGPTGVRRILRVLRDAYHDIAHARPPQSRVPWHLTVFGAAWLRRTD